MTYGEAIVSVLSGASTVTAICGARVFSWPVPPDTAMPAISYRFTGGQGESLVIDGQGEGIDRLKFELSAWGSSQSTARALAQAARKALNGWRGWQGTTEIQLIECEAAFDLPEPETGLYRSTFLADVVFTTR